MPLVPLMSSRKPQVSLVPKLRYPCHRCCPCCYPRPCRCPPPCCLPPNRCHDHEANALDVLAKTPSLSSPRAEILSQVPS